MSPSAATNRVDLIFRAFSDRTRLRILHLLQEGEICVGDLVKILRVPQATTSRHLAYFRRSGLVLTNKKGLWIYYSLAPARGVLHRKLLDCLNSCFVEVPELRIDRERLRSSRKSGSCCPA